MLGKLCVTRVDKEYVEGYFLAEKGSREEFVQIKRVLINTPVSPGDVVRLDYSWRSIAVFETLDEKFFRVVATPLEKLKLSHVVIAESQQEADLIFAERVSEDFEKTKACCEVESLGIHIG